MRTGKSIYHRTEAGEQALQRSDASLAREDRAVLASIEDATHFDAIQARLRQCSTANILRSLDALETCGFVESVKVEWVRELYRIGCYEPAALKRLTAPASSSYRA